MEFSQFGAEMVVGGFFLAVLGSVAVTMWIMNAIFKRSDEVRRAEWARYRVAQGCPIPEDEERTGRHRPADKAAAKGQSSAARLIESLRAEREPSNA
jgi:hypothetical protein